MFEKKVNNNGQRDISSPMMTDKECEDFD